MGDVRTVAGKHTPGPWRVDDFGKIMIFAGEMRICDIRGWGHLTGGLRLSEEGAAAIQDANANLIATAPKMLDALRLAQRQMLAMGWAASIIPANREAYFSTVKAIAEAGGK
jgi:hypothetical protein